jgi:tetratricopeptide (TPR) repeat protein
MPANIFISLTEQDTPIAMALRDAFRQLLGDSALVYFSTNKEVEGGISPGTDWFEWIITRVRECDFALILLTPTSVQKPWLLWEVGAVHGAAIASSKQNVRKVRPLLYQLSTAQLPSPIRDSQVQFRRGDKADDMENFFTDILGEYQQGELAFNRLATSFKVLPKTVATYLEVVESRLRDSPALPDTIVVEEWRLRLDDLLKTGRASEVEHLHHWMDIAFGRDSDGRSQPLDMRIHNRLAEMYLKARKYARAIEQFHLSLRLAPRDLFVLRHLGRAYLESGDRQQAKAVIDRIDQLDAQATLQNVECAALAARWYREGSNYSEAIRILSAALDYNPDSYYLANVLGEVCLETGQLTRAQEAFNRALQAISTLTDTNVWTRATAANAAFVLGDDLRADTLVKEIASVRPGADTQAIIERGLQHLAKQLPNGQTRLTPLLSSLRGDAVLVE